MSRRKVAFVIAGQPKSGTTALAHFLAEHPQVCMSYPKEPCYFATDFMKESDSFHGKPKYYKVRTPEQYDKHFAHAEEGQILGDASTSYAYSKEAARNIYGHNPEAKIIIMLRNPVEFIHSLHMQYVNETVEDETDFEKALELEPERKKGRNIPPKTRCPSYHFYRERAKYAKHVERFFEQFGKDNVMVIANEDFRENSNEVYTSILRFLGVDENILPEFKTIHSSKSPRTAWLNRIAHTMWLKNALYKLLGPVRYTKIQKRIEKLLLKPEPRQTMDTELRKKLETQLGPEVAKLNHLSGQDFAAMWGFRK